jgi:hypothetical protein
VLSPVELRPFDYSIVDVFGGADRPEPSYLYDYLHTLGAKSLVFEPRYVDRHYLDEYAHYYATSFVPPGPGCQRFHFFAASIDELDSLLGRAFDGEHATVQREIAQRELYLGFVVRRPLPAARIGRTVLRTYPVDGRRNYQAVRAYHVNLCGLRITLDGLAYQQQDGGAAVCASVALWSALQSVADMAGHRTPTPMSITRASGTPFPASVGLHSHQMATALSNLGYLAESFAPGTNRDAFRTKLVTCLDSQLPVVLLLAQREPSTARKISESDSRSVSPDDGWVTSGHAVTLTGYAEPTRVVEVLPTVAREGPPIPMRAASVEVVYTHDDNLGSHAHYELFDSEQPNAQGEKTLVLFRGRRDRPAKPWWRPDEWEVLEALVCKPPKLRASVDELIADIRFVRPLVEQVILQGMPLPVHYSARFSSGVRLKSSILSMPLDRSGMREFQLHTSFPRHVGIVSVHTGSVHILDLVLDASQLRRDPSLPLLAIVAPGVMPGSRAWNGLRGIQAVGMPVILGNPL